MAYFPNIHLVLLLLVALAHQLYGIEVTEDTIERTRARRILYQGSSDDEYAELMDMYIDLASSGQTLYDLPVHPVQTELDQPPPWWIPIDIVGRDKDTDRTSLLIRGDNGYLIGFTNWTGHYHPLDGPSKNLIPKATVLESGVTYRDLLGPGESGNIPQLPLSEDLFLDGAHVLGTYPASSRKEMETAAGRFVVMICEGARIKAIRQLISENWDVGECRVDKKTADYVVRWGTMSLCLFCAARGIALKGSDAKDLRDVSISTAEEVKNILGIVVVPTRFDPNNAEKSCAHAPKTPLTDQQKRRRNQKNMERRKRRKEEKQGQGQGHQGSGSAPH